MFLSVKAIDYLLRGTTQVFWTWWVGQRYRLSIHSAHTPSTWKSWNQVHGMLDSVWIQATLLHITSFASFFWNLIKWFWSCSIRVQILQFELDTCWHYNWKDFFHPVHFHSSPCPLKKQQSHTKPTSTILALWSLNFSSWQDLGSAFGDFTLLFTYFRVQPVNELGRMNCVMWPWQV